jgi:hypothetical protein
MNHLTATAPPDCTVSPPGYDTPAALAVSVDVVQNSTFTVQCNQPSFHAFTFSNQSMSPLEAWLIPTRLTTPTRRSGR